MWDAAAIVAFCRDFLEKTGRAPSAGDVASMPGWNVTRQRAWSVLRELVKAGALRLVKAGAEDRHDGYVPADAEADVTPAGRKRGVSGDRLRAFLTRVRSVVVGSVRVTATLIARLFRGVAGYSDGNVRAMVRAGIGAGEVIRNDDGTVSFAVPMPSPAPSGFGSLARAVRSVGALFVRAIPFPVLAANTLAHEPLRLAGYASDHTWSFGGEP